MTTPNTIIADLVEQVETLTKQRDELLAALECMMNAHMDLCYESEPNYLSYKFRQQRLAKAKSVIASVKGNAA